MDAKALVLEVQEANTYHPHSTLSCLVSTLFVMGTKDVGDCFVSFNVRSVSSSSMARSIRWPWVLLILILISLPGEHGVGASAAPPPPGDSCNSHASSTAGKIAVQIIGVLLSGVFFVGALYVVRVAQRLRFFLCHAGGINQEGKNFTERLYDEMTRSWKLKFFITVFFDGMVLLEDLFFPQIFKELERTQVCIVLVTPEFFTRKWPMVELVYFMESFERSSNMRRVLPLFYGMTARQVRDNLRAGVWEAEWRKMSTHGDHPLSVERCRHAVERLCLYAGVEYWYSGIDRGHDREYIREILKCVGEIVCEEIWTIIRARNLENSSWRGHAPDRQKIGTLSTKSTISSSHDPNSLDEDDRQIARALSEENQHVDNEVGNPLTKLESMKGNEEEHQYVDKEVGNRLTKVKPIQKVLPVLVNATFLLLIIILVFTPNFIQFFETHRFGPILFPSILLLLITLPLLSLITRLSLRNYVVTTKLMVTPGLIWKYRFWLLLGTMLKSNKALALKLADFVRRMIPHLAPCNAFQDDVSCTATTSTFIAKTDLDHIALFPFHVGVKEQIRPGIVFSNQNFKIGEGSVSVTKLSEDQYRFTCEARGSFLEDFVAITDRKSMAITLGILGFWEASPKVGVVRILHNGEIASTVML